MSTFRTTAARTKPAKRESPSAPSPEPLPQLEGWQRWRSLVLILLGGQLPYLAFVGFGFWPLAFVAFVPFLFVLEWERERRPRMLLGLAWIHGAIQHAGGYYWLVDMLQNFSGFGSLANIGISSVFWFFQGGQMVVFAWLYTRARSRGWAVFPVAVAGFCATELFYPFLFPAFVGNSFVELTALIQIVDLGGPVLLTGLYIAANVAVYELLVALLSRTRLPRTSPAIAVGAIALSLLYGVYRIDEVEGRMSAAPKITVGMVQANMGIFAKRSDPREGHRRHVEDTLRLEREVNPDLVVWPESAFAYFVPASRGNLQRFVTGRIRTPLLFGGLARRDRKSFNTAFLVDGEGDVIATYDKTFLLAFGEYLPFGDTFPILYEWSPNSGRFSPGTHQKPMPFEDYRISTLICYEDVLPGFTRAAVQEADPHLLVNITNDAWFGDTHEPWIHLALARFRAVEHHRYLVRSTNSGVSAIIDPLGRVTAVSGTFTREVLSGEVAMLEEGTLFETLGSWPGWIALVSIVVFAIRRRGALRRREKA